MSYNDETWHSYALPKEDTKNILITLNTLRIPVTLEFLYRKSAIFIISRMIYRAQSFLIISRNTDKDCILMHNL